MQTSASRVLLQSTKTLQYCKQQVFRDTDYRAARHDSVDGVRRAPLRPLPQESWQHAVGWEHHRAGSEHRHVHYRTSVSACFLPHDLHVTPQEAPQAYQILRHSLRHGSHPHRASQGFRPSVPDLCQLRGLAQQGRGDSRRCAVQGTHRYSVDNGGVAAFDSKSLWECCDLFMSVSDLLVKLNRLADSMARPAVLVASSTLRSITSSYSSTQ